MLLRHRVIDDAQAAVEVAACDGTPDGDPCVTRDDGVAEAITDLERPPGALDAPGDVTAVEGSQSLRVEDVRVLALLGSPAASCAARATVCSASPR